MSRLIDANALIGELHKTYLYDDNARKVIYRKIEEQPTICGWISVKDRLPERNGIYLAYDGEYISTVEYEKGRPDSEWTDDYEGYLDLLVTHWMPLPEPPKE